MAGREISCSPWQFVPSWTLRLDNSPGSLARLCQTLKAEKINAIAFNLESSGVLLLVPDNPVHAAGLLRRKDYAVEEREVLYVPMPNSPGALSSTTGMLSAVGVNVNYAFAAAGNEHAMSALVIAVDDAPRAGTTAGM